MMVNNLSLGAGWFNMYLGLFKYAQKSQYGCNDEADFAYALLTLSLVKELEKVN